MPRLVDVYPYLEEQSRVKFLILKRTAKVTYPNQWRMVGGKVRESEKYYEAAIRELKEETGLTPVACWTIPSLNQFYDPKEDSLFQIPAFGARVNKYDTISLNHEHSEYQWVTKDEIDKFISWPEQRRLMKLLADIVTNNEILEEWIIKVPK